MMVYCLSGPQDVLELYKNVLKISKKTIKSIYFLKYIFVVTPSSRISMIKKFGDNGVLKSLISSPNKTIQKQIIP